MIPPVIEKFIKDYREYMIHYIDLGNRECIESAIVINQYNHVFTIKGDRTNVDIPNEAAENGVLVWHNHTHTRFCDKINPDEPEYIRVIYEATKEEGNYNFSNQDLQAAEAWELKYMCVGYKQDGKYYLKYIDMDNQYIWDKEYRGLMVTLNHYMTDFDAAKLEYLGKEYYKWVNSISTRVEI